MFSRRRGSVNRVRISLPDKISRIAPGASRRRTLVNQYSTDQFYAAQLFSSGDCCQFRFPEELGLDYLPFLRCRRSGPALAYHLPRTHRQHPNETDATTRLCFIHWQWEYHERKSWNDLTKTWHGYDGKTRQSELYDRTYVQISFTGEHTFV